MKARLFVLAGPDIGRSFQVRHGDTLGRSPECIVSLRHPSVSRKHAHLEVRGGAFWIVDDGSRNGIGVQGERVARLELRDHLEFSLGELTLRFRLAEPGGSDGAGGADALAVTRVSPVLSALPELGAETVVENEGLELEAPDEIRIEPARPAAPARTDRAPQPAGRAVLQYHKVPNARGIAVSDLAQYPLAVRVLVGVLAAALAGALFLLAFRGTAYLRGQASAPDAGGDRELSDS